MSGGHLILVGLPGAGKTTVGRLVAQDLGVPFVDVDTLIEERIGVSIAEIFADQGEAAFRELERQCVAKLAAEHSPCVIAPGGGWAAQPGTLRSVAGEALTVYLETAPAVAAERSRGGPERPLLADRREEGMRELHGQRERFYARCDASVPTDNRTPREVASEVVELARISEG